MKLITRIHTIINFAVDKGFTGYHSPEEIDNEIFATMMDMYNEFAAAYAANSRIRDYMAPFLISDEDIVRGNDKDQVGEYLVFKKPEKFQHDIELVLVVGGTDEEDEDDVEDVTEIDIIDNAGWAWRLKDSINPPSIQSPVARIDSTTFIVRPLNGLEEGETEKTELARVRLTYLKTPIIPEMKYTVNNGQIILDDGGSTDVEFGVLLHNTIRDKVLSALGINLREPEIIQYSRSLDNKVQ